MAKRTPESKKPTLDEIRAAVPRLRNRLQELRSLDVSTVTERGDPRFAAIDSKVKQMLSDLFGSGTPDYRRFSPWFDEAIPMYVGYAPDVSEIQEGYTKGIADAVAKLESLLELFEEQLPVAEADTRSPDPSARDRGRKIFLVHGHDEAAKQEVARFLERLRLEPIILHEQLNRGQTIIEKFERHSAEAHFAVVLLTPDDIGYAAGREAEQRPRARQNVVLELGFFVAKLGREHVVALNKGDVEIPSDFQGVIYEQMDTRNGWKLAVAREIKGAGIDVDLNLAI
jgi:predicted nucleotide-binding protein